MSRQKTDKINFTSTLALFLTSFFAFSSTTLSSEPKSPPVSETPVESAIAIPDTICDLLLSLSGVPEEVLPLKGELSSNQTALLMSLQFKSAEYVEMVTQYIDGLIESNKRSVDSSLRRNRSTGDHLQTFVVFKGSIESITHIRSEIEGLVSLFEEVGDLGLFGSADSLASQIPNATPYFSTLDTEREFILTDSDTPQTAALKLQFAAQLARQNPTRSIKVKRPSRQDLLLLAATSSHQKAIPADIQIQREETALTRDAALRLADLLLQETFDQRFGLRGESAQLITYSKSNNEVGMIIVPESTTREIRSKVLHTELENWLWPQSTSTDQPQDEDDLEEAIEVFLNAPGSLDGHPTDQAHHIFNRLRTLYLAQTEGDPTERGASLPPSTGLFFTNERVSPVIQMELYHFFSRSLEPALLAGEPNAFWIEYLLRQASELGLRTQTDLTLVLSLANEHTEITQEQIVHFRRHYNHDIEALEVDFEEVKERVRFQQPRDDWRTTHLPDGTSSYRRNDLYYASRDHHPTPSRPTVDSPALELESLLNEFSLVAELILAFLSDARTPPKETENKLLALFDSGKLRQLVELSETQIETIDALMRDHGTNITNPISSKTIELARKLNSQGETSPVENRKLILLASRMMRRKDLRLMEAKGITNQVKKVLSNLTRSQEILNVIHPAHPTSAASTEDPRMISVSNKFAKKDLGNALDKLPFSVSGNGRILSLYRIEILFLAFWFEKMRKLRPDLFDEYLDAMDSPKTLIDGFKEFIYFSPEVIVQLARLVSMGGQEELEVVQGIRVALIGSINMISNHGSHDLARTQIDRTLLDLVSLQSRENNPLFHAYVSSHRAARRESKLQGSVRGVGVYINTVPESKQHVLVADFSMYTKSDGETIERIEREIRNHLGLYDNSFE